MFKRMIICIDCEKEFDGKWAKRCKSCRGKKYYEDNKQRIHIKRQKRYEEVREVNKRSYVKNKNKILAKRKKVRNKCPKFKKKNAGYTATRRLMMQSKISKMHKKEIYNFYENKPEGCHVDHIIPIKGKTVCGLHVPWNLQYLSVEENLKKGNKICLI